jgi:transcription elongation factor Elf1
MTTIYKTESFELVNCAKCGVAFCVTNDFASRRRSERDSFYCPSGHSQWFPGESDKDRAQKLAGQLDQERTRLQQERRSRLQTEQALDYARRTRKAVSTRLRKVKTRVGHGICPCCNRTFEQLARHMAVKHPLYAKSTD